jgi:4-hydroxythreonine-4-phosphate dehydrogenase
MGDPAGIGPEVTLKALADPEIAALARYLIVGDAWVLQETSRQLGLPTSASISIIDQEMVVPEQFVPGRLSALCGQAALEYIRVATLLCLEDRADALVTAPVNKEAITLSGAHFTGHTETIAELCGAAESRMLLVNAQLRVVHVSTHVGLRQACSLDTARIVQTIRLGNEAVRAMGVIQPRIGVCGLNPHAGENGLFGDEDRRFILPAIQTAQAEGIVCEGPLAADTLFLKAVRGAYDLVVALYHDQGHIPMKLLDFEHTVNVSLGLPIIRTSVDHGTAFDIVGQNRADPDSMQAALRLAVTMARNARRTS